MPSEIEKIKINKKTVGFFRFKKLNGKYLITNDFGYYIFLTPAQFKKFLAGDSNQELEEKGFIKNNFNLDKLMERYLSRNASVLIGPSLHIMVITLRCNFKCIYCQASSRPMEEEKYDMSKNTAKQAVDLAFQSPSPAINIEFQGGEPLVNWPVVKFIAEYARKKNETAKKQLLMSLVTNLTLMSEERFNFLLKNKVSICTSLDGPEKIHNRNRPWAKGNSYKATTDWIRKIQRFEKKKEKEGEKMYHLSALLTLSRFSLPYPKEIIDEYLKWGFDGIHIRPLSYLGASGVLKNTIGYSAEEFLDFWKKAMDYIISINLKGKLFSERGARIMLQKILTDQDTGFLDLRSPCGAAIGQVLYDYDGKIYTCDEGRMLKGDTFMIGDANKDNYQKIISNDKIKTMITASTLENLTCDNCAYKPYCGVCPVINYALYGNLFPQISNTDWCKTHRGMLDYLFDKIENKKIKEEVFDKWLEK